MGHFACRVNEAFEILFSPSAPPPPFNLSLYKMWNYSEPLCSKCFSDILSAASLPQQTHPTTRRRRLCCGPRFVCMTKHCSRLFDLWMTLWTAAAVWKWVMKSKANLTVLQCSPLPSPPPHPPVSFLLGHQLRLFPTLHIHPSNSRGTGGTKGANGDRGEAVEGGGLAKGYRSTAPCIMDVYY